MKAAVRDTYGPPAVLRIEEVDKPSLGDNDILVRVHAATVNRTDCAILSAKPFIMRFITGLLKPKNPITGTDFAVEVDSVGKNVTSYAVGDRVFGLSDDGIGSHARFIPLPQEAPMAAIPDSVSYEQAAASRGALRL
ncbi:MAG: alcohol dehydrogenase catalytic domain-containing protein [Chitinispirillaceae bacterium]